MRFFHYLVYSGDPSKKEPVGHCALGENDSLLLGNTFDELKDTILSANPSAEVLDNCGWILEGDHIKLLDRDFDEILRFNIRIRQNRIEKEKEK